MTRASSVQALCDMCKKTFTPSGVPPAASQPIQELRSLLDMIGPEDVGLTDGSKEDDRGHGFFGTNRLDRVARWAQPITYLNIHECDSFTMCIFCLPTSSVLPLHDHPGMTVLSKVIYGSMHVKAYDWVEPAYIQTSREPNQLPGNITESYKGREESYVWLKEIDTPDDLYMRSGRYAGPPIEL